MPNVTIERGNALNSKGYRRILVHSCNCYGSWGGGIARQLALKYPKTETDYETLCEKYGAELLGKCAIIPSYKDPNLLIACLFTSAEGGSRHDAESEILRYTREALFYLYLLLNKQPSNTRAEIDQELYSRAIDIGTSLIEYKIEMPKINSGIFGVPWQETQNILEEFKGKMKFKVYDF